MPGRHQGRFTPLQVVVDVLHHHYGVVHHQADGENERQQGDEVDGKTEIPGADEGRNERHRHSDGGDQGGARLPQEEVEHGHHQQGTDGEGLVHLVDGLLDEDGGVIVHLQGGPRWQEALHLCHLALYALGHRQGVGGGLRDYANA
ncbi:hypothetical protein D3C71_1023270 [compost metagenome]